MASDDQVAERFNDLILATLDEAIYLLRNGSPDYQMALIKATMPSLAKSMDSDAESTSITVLRARQQELMAGIMEQLTPDPRAIVDAQVIAEDSP